MLCRISVLGLALLAACRVGGTGTSAAPVLDVSPDGYTGKVREDQSSVTLIPRIRLAPNSPAVCEYRVQSTGGGDTPFVVDLVDGVSGEATLNVKDGVTLDCSLAQYKLTITAIGCDAAKSASNTVGVAVHVQDTNNHAPEFEQPWYTVEVDEGRLYTEILRLKATDGDCGQPYGNICRYEISNDNNNNQLPFELTDQGVLRNTRPLSYNESRNHILSVVAHDCGMRKSKPTLVTVKVKQTCTAGLRDVVERLDYYPGSGGKYVARQAQLVGCGECDVQRVDAVVRLNAEHIGRGCDRDAFSSAALRKSCAVHPNTVDLLPRPEHSENDVLGEDIVTDEVYMFDGVNNAIVISPQTARSLVPHTFSLSFWMKKNSAIKGGGHGKETILCSSDDHKMNRHHFALFVRNCKLEMVSRREPDEATVASGGDDGFQPAEWRWTMSQTCDNQWHHYAIHMTNNTPQLVVDGRPFQTTAGNPEILDDLPLHKTKDLKTRMVVGACWQGKASKMAQFFTGYISNMLYLPGTTESTSTMACLQECKEALELVGLDQLHPGEMAVLNSDKSELRLSGGDVNAVSQMLRRVAYTNTRHSPTPGHRSLQITTKLKCKDKSELLELPQFKGFIFVQKAAQPKLVITAKQRLERSKSEIKQGTRMFEELAISVTQPNSEGTAYETTDKHKMDSCVVELMPNRVDVDHEYFSSPAALIAQYNLDFEHNKAGLALRGAESVRAYAAVLGQIHYFNTKDPEDRSYSLTCTLLNAHVTSNPLQVHVRSPRALPHDSDADVGARGPATPAHGRTTQANAATRGRGRGERVQLAPNRVRPRNGFTRTKVIPHSTGRIPHRTELYRRRRGGSDSGCVRRIPIGAVGGWSAASATAAQHAQI